MYKTLLKIAVLIIGIFYIASFCEFDQQEYRQNYDNEIHVYIHNDNVNAKPIKLPVVVKQLYTIPVKIDIPNQTLTTSQSIDFYPSLQLTGNKIYLFDSVFLI